MTKTDNARLDSKLELRRYFLRKYPLNPLRVLDCCSGQHVVWSALRLEFPVGVYFPLDTKRTKGQLALDSTRYLACGQLDFDVIDVDTYRYPWKHWGQICKHASQGMTVFMTRGNCLVGGGQVDKAILQALGLHFSVQIPAPLLHALIDEALPAIFAQANNGKVRVVEAAEGSCGPHARYFGVRLEKLATTSG